MEFSEIENLYRLAINYKFPIEEIYDKDMVNKMIKSVNTHRFLLNDICKNRCTFQLTGNNFVNQQYARCLDCFSADNEGACLYCIKTCHAGHRISPMSSGIFFCDCGANNCKIVPKIKDHLKDMKDMKGQPSSNTFFNQLSPIMEKNYVCSPFNIAMAMAMVQYGASGNTEQELSRVFGKKYTIDELSAVMKLFNNGTTKIANAIIANKNMPIKATYFNAMRNLALVSSEDFMYPRHIADQVNSFIESNTNGLIKDVIGEYQITYETMLIIISTIYFKANWDKQFDKNKTYMDQFYHENGASLVSMMTQTDKFPYYEDADYQTLEMPYKYNEYCMTIVLPKNDTTFKNKIPTNMWLNSFSKTKVKVCFPKFTQRKNMNLVPSLKKLGINDVFTEKAQLDGLTDEGGFVSEIIHEAVVIVDEEGTEAAAATVVLMTKGLSISPPIPVFNANHPFGYCIKHIPTNTILFAGEYHGF